MTVTVTPMENSFSAEIAEMDLSRPIGGEDRDAVYGAFLEIITSSSFAARR